MLPIGRLKIPGQQENVPLVTYKSDNRFDIQNKKLF